MGFNFSFFGNQEHRVFNYKPRYYDPEKEERKRIFGKVDGSEASAAQSGSQQSGSQKSGSQQSGSRLSGASSEGRTSGASSEGYTPGKYLSGSFRDGNYQRTKMATNKTQKIFGLVGLLLFFVILYFFVQFYSYLLK